MMAETFHVIFPPITAQRIQRDYPADWLDAFGNDRVIIVVDSTNINIETPLDPGMNTCTFSDYYGGNVVKLLIGQTPQGYLSYFSRAFPGKITDTDLLESTLFVSGQLESMIDVLGDKGFMNFTILASKGIGLRLPPKSRRGYDFSFNNAADTRLFANKRIHVERTMSRIKAFGFLKRVLRSNRWDIISDAVNVICHLCNLQSPLTDTRTAEHFNLDDYLVIEAVHNGSHDN